MGVAREASRLLPRLGSGQRPSRPDPPLPLRQGEVRSPAFRRSRSLPDDRASWKDVACDASDPRLVCLRDRTRPTPWEHRMIPQTEKALDPRDWIRDVPDFPKPGII